MKRLMIIITIAALMVGAFAGMLYANNADPGSSADPLVTRSFVVKYVNDKLGSGTGEGAGQWQIEEIKAGGIFLGGTGTEVLVRTGQAVCVDPTTTGIPNLTTGANIFNGQSIPRNNLILVPRQDGRGLKANTDVIIMYRGAGNVKY